MKLYQDYDLLEDMEYEPWSGAIYNYNKIIESNRSGEFIAALEEIYPEGLTTTELNDILWFEDAFCYQFVDDELLNEEELEMKNNY